MLNKPLLIHAAMRVPNVNCDCGGDFYIDEEGNVVCNRCGEEIESDTDTDLSKFHIK